MYTGSIIGFRASISVNSISCLDRERERERALHAVGDTPLPQFIREYIVFSLGLVSFWDNSARQKKADGGSSVPSCGLYLKT